MTFPTTPVLDDFNRSNANPIAGNWSGPWIGTEDELQLLSNELAPDAAPGSSYWNVETFGPDAEVHCLIATKQAEGGFIALALRLTTIGDGTTDGYTGANLARAGTDTWRYDRFDNGSSTKLGADEDLEFATGDSMGFEIIGSTLTLYHKTSGSWSALATRTDGTYSAAGSIGVRVIATTDQTMDDFGGGKAGRVMSSLAHYGGLAGLGGIAGQGGGLAA